MFFQALFKPLQVRRGLLTKTLLIMRLTAFLVLAACLQANARGYGQTISLKETNVSLEKVFKQIKKQSGYEFWYEDRLIQKANLVDIKVQGATLDQVLKLLFKDQPLSYEVVGKTVAIKEKEAVKDVNLPPPPPPISVHGRIVNEKGDPVPGATVTVKGSKKAIATNDNGEFFIEANKGEVLIVSYVGYTPQEFTVKENTTTINVSLKIADQVINEVVVTALGIKKGKKSPGLFSY